MITFVGSMISVFILIGYIETRINKQMKPNGGSSLKDQLNRLEARVDALYDHLIK